MPGTLPIRVDGDPARALEALRAVVALRERALPVALWLRGCDPRATLALHTVPNILRALRKYDERRAAFDALAAETLQIEGRAMRELSALDPRALRTLRDAARCADRVVLGSWRQFERLPSTLDIRPENVLISTERVLLPEPRIGLRTAVLVYAPRESAAVVAGAVFALQEIHADILVVGDASLCADMRCAVIAADEGLGRARVIVAPAIDDPSTACALTALDAALVAPSTTGIDEWVAGAIRYDPWNRLALLAAVQEAVGAPRARLLQQPSDVIIAPAPPHPGAADVVTIAIRTFNRRELFARAIASVDAQSYEYLDIVVVNDGDDDVAEIVARYPRARLVGNQERLGAIPSLNVALHAARGRWFGWLDDDDRLFPDHVARLVDALVASGARAAHADTLSEYFEREPDGTYRRYGLAVNLDDDVDRDRIHVADGIGPMSALVDRALLVESGGFDESLGHAEDWELWIRLSRAHDLVHVRAVTAAYAIRNDASNMMTYGGTAMLGAMRRMVALDDLRDRPQLAAARRELIAVMERSGGRATFPEPPLRFSE